MWDSLLFALWFFWPAGIATLVPVFAAHTPVIKDWNWPMDFGLSWRGKRLTGDHKTWRGFFAGGIAGGLAIWLQIVVFNHSDFVRDFCPSGYGSHQTLLLGALLGFGAVFGDAVKSFFKRQAGVAAGQAWFPFDQVDFILGGIIFSLASVRLAGVYYLIILIVWPFVHIFFGWLGYMTNLKQQII